MKKSFVVALMVMSSIAVASSQYDKSGFVTKIENERLWVFEADSKELAQFEAHGEPTISVSIIGDGPEGMTLRGPSMQVLEAYQAK